MAIDIRVIENIIVSLTIGISAVLLNERLPDFIRPTLESQIKVSLRESTRATRIIALEVAVRAADFVSSTGAIFGLLVSIMTELWKESVDIVLLVATIFLIPLALVFFRTNWAGQNDFEYAKKTGFQLRWAVRILSFIVFLMPLVEAWHGQAPQSASPKP